MKHPSTTREQPGGFNSASRPIDRLVGGASRVYFVCTVDRVRKFIDYVYAAERALIALDGLDSRSAPSTVSGALDRAATAYEHLLVFRQSSRLVRSEEFRLENVLDRLEVKMHMFGRSA
jgi:hypothetical protein